MNSYENHSLSYECDLTVERDLLRAALEMLMASEGGEPRDDAESQAAWRAAREALTFMRRKP